MFEDTVSLDMASMLRNLIGATSIEPFNPITLRKAKIVYNFGLSECNRVKNKLHSRLVPTFRHPGKQTVSH